MAQPFNLTVALNLQGPSNVRKIVSDIKKQLSNIKAEVKLDIKAAAAKDVAAINKQMQSLSKNAADANRTVSGLVTSLNQLSNSFNTANSLSVQFNNSINNGNRNLKNVSKNIGGATTAIEDFGKQSALAIKRFAAFSVVTSIINRFSAAVTNGFSAFIDYDRQLVRIAQVTKGSASSIQQLSKEIGSLGQKFGVASDELAEVSLTLAQAGLTAEQARVALEALAKTSLAATFDSINTTTEGSIALMRQFKIGVQDLEAALGSINAVAAAFAVESGDIITAVQRAGGVFASASKGVSEGKDALNEFVAVFTSVRATTRESAETIATGLRTIFTRIQRGSTIKFLREFGVELQDSQGKFVGAYEAVRRLSEGLSQLDPRDVRFTRIVEELGGFRQIGKVIPLIQEFATAQDALGVAQRGTTSLSSDAIQAQQALAVQFAKTREEFLALIRDIGQSGTFKTITSVVLGLASAFIKVAGALKPILPLLTAITAIKGFKFITEFISGFKGGLGGAGAGGIGNTIGNALGGGGGGGGGGRPGGGGGITPQLLTANTNAVTGNTTQLTTVANNVAQLNNAINNLQRTLVTSVNVIGKLITQNRTGNQQTLNNGGRVFGFAGGGTVPGSGNRDTVPAMLTPGEFVIRKKAVETIGVDKLVSMNKYAGGGVIKQGQESRDVGIFDSDMISDATQKKLVLEQIKASKKPYQVIAGPAGAGKTTFATGRFGRNFVMSAADIDKYSKFVVLSGAGKTKTGDFSDNTKSLLNGASDITVLSPSPERLMLQRQGRLDSAMSGQLPDTRSISGLQGTLKAPTDINEDLYRQYKNVNVVREYEDAGGVKSLSVSEIIDSVGGIKEAGRILNIDPLNVRKELKKKNTTADTLKQQLKDYLLQKEAALPQFGLVGLRGQTFNEVAKTPNTNRAVRIIGAPLPQNIGDNYQSIMENEFINTIKNIGSDLASGVNAQLLPDNQIRGLIGKTGFYNAVGAYLESAIASVGAPFKKDATNDPIDFPEGLGAIASKFGLQPDTPADATRTVGDSKELNERGKSKAKFLGQVERYIEKSGVQMASGGNVNDTVPALLTPGEFVINKKAAARIGSAKLNKLNRADKIQGFNKGGAVGYIQRFADGGGVDPALESSINDLDKNLKGLGDILREAITVTGSDAALQSEAVHLLQKLINDVNAARSGGDITAIVTAEENLKNEIKQLRDGLKAFKASQTPKTTTKPGGLGYPGSMATATPRPGGLGYPGSMATGQINTAATQTSLQKLIEKIDKLSNKTGSFVGTFSGALASVIPTIDNLVNTFDQLNNTTIATSVEFARFRGALEQGSSYGLSGSIAAKQAGLGKRGAAVVGGLGFLGGAISGGIAGETERNRLNIMAEAGAANTRMERSRADFGEAESQRERLQALQEFTQASAEYSQSIDAANNELDGSYARAGRAIGNFTDALIQGISALGTLRMARRGFSKGGPVYAAKGQLVNYQPKGTDTVPAMLSPGEFVVNARSTSRNRGLLEAINKSSGGIIKPKYLQRGGRSFKDLGKSTWSDFFAEYMGRSGVAGTGGYLDFLNRNFNPFTEEDVNAQDKGLQRAAQGSMGIGLAAGTAAGGLAVGGGGILSTLGSGALRLGGGALRGVGRLGGGALRGVGRLGGGALRGAGRLGGAALRGAGKLGRRVLGRGGRRGGGLLGNLGNLADIAGFGLAAFPGALATVQEFSPFKTPEQMAREQEALGGSFGRISEGARMRGETARLGSPVVDRAVQRLQQQRAAGITPEQRRSNLGMIAGAGEASAGLVQEQARQQRLAQEGFKIPLDQTVEEYLKTLNDTEKKTAEEAIKASDDMLKKQALVNALNKQFADLPVDQRQKKINEALENFADPKYEDAIKREIGAQEEIAAKRAEQAQASRKFVAATADLSAIMTRLSAGMVRVGNEIDDIINKTNSYTGALQGNASAVASIASSGVERDQQVLSNLSAYSGAELEQTLGRVTTGLGGSAPIQQAADLVRAQQVLEKTRPTLEAAVKATEGVGAGATQEQITKVLEDAFKDIPFTDPNIAKQFIEAASREIAGGGPDAAKNIEQFLAKSAQATKLFEQYSRLAAEGLRKLATQSDALTQSLMRVTELEIKRAEIGIESQNDLKQALGFRLTPGEATAASQARVRGLMGPGGPTDPAGIAAKMQDDIAKRKAIEEAGPQAVQASMASGEFAKLNQAINQSRAALEFLANDTTAADNALKRIAERDKQLRQQSETALDFASDPLKALEFVGQAQSLSRVLSGRGGQMDVGAGRAALQQLEGMIPEEQFNKLRERFFSGTGASLGLGREMAPFAAGAASTVDGKKRDAVMAQEIANYEAAVAVRQQAMDQLIAIEQQGATNIGVSLQEINTKLTAQLGPLVDEINAELTKLKNGLAGVAGPLPPPNAGAAIPVPPINNAANTATVGGPSIGAPPVPVNAVANAPAIPAISTVATAQPSATQSLGRLVVEGNQIPNSIEIAGNTTTNVVVSFSSEDMKALNETISTNVQRNVGSLIANAISRETNNTINITKYLG